MTEIVKLSLGLCVQSSLFDFIPFYCIPIKTFLPIHFPAEKKDEMWMQQHVKSSLDMHWNVAQRRLC